MAISKDGRTLYPSLEGPLVGDDPTRPPRCTTFDIASRRYTGRNWIYRVSDPGYLVSDPVALTATACRRSSATTARARPRPKKAFVDRRPANRRLQKREILDLLDITDPTASR